MPSANPNAQKRVFESTITRQIPNIDKASNEVSIVFFGPITSSTEANKAAPRPAVRFIAIPNRIISLRVKPKEPAA